VKAVVYEGPRKIKVQEVPDARLERPTDALVKITSTNICGSDLHMYEGRTDVEKGKVLGHENLGRIAEVDEAVDRIKVGDLVCLPFNVSCGFCRNCERGFTGFCLTTNPGNAGAAYGYAGMGPTRAVRPNTSAYHMPTSIASGYLPMPKKKKRTM
jgi:glutathione-independent formaldehyde dehydrogenase